MAERPIITYVVSYPSAGVVKIGQAKYYADRFMQLGNGSPVQPEPLCAFIGAKHERELHTLFMHLRTRREYFHDTEELRKHLAERPDRITHEEALKLSPLIVRGASFDEALGDVDSLSEAEVSLRLAFWFLDNYQDDALAEVAIDGAHVRIAAHEQAGRRIEERIIFDIRGFLAANSCVPTSAKDEWRGTYNYKGKSLSIRSATGFDVRVTDVRKTAVAECKGGPLGKPKGRGASAILASAIGQALTTLSGTSVDEVWVAVPDSPAFASAAKKAAQAPMFAKTGIRIALVSAAGVRTLSE